jgi:hypothetical protein
MRIAVCFYGQIRKGGVKAAPNILRYIGDLKSSCDFFVHTWDAETLGTNYSLRVEHGADPLDPIWHTPNNSSNENFTEFFKNFTPRAMEVEEYNLQKTISTWGGRRWDPVTNKWNVSMWRSIQESNKLKINYAGKNNINYDYTIILRTDAVFAPNKSLASDLTQIIDDNTLLFGDHMNVWPVYDQRRIEEVLWLGSTSVIDKVSKFSDYYISTVSNIDEPSDPGYRDWQFYCAEWITKVLGIKFFPIQDSTIRVYTQIDAENNVDPMDPGFGNPPSRFGYKR